MPLGTKRALLVVAAAATALALVPGSTTAAGTADDDPLDVARTYLAKSAEALGVTPADVVDLAVISSYRSAHNGVSHVNLNQRFRDLEVFGGHVTVNVASDGRVLLAGGSLARGLADSPSGTASVEPTAAVRAAAAALNLGEPSDLRVISEAGGPARETVVSPGGISEAPIPLRLGWQPTGGGLRLAWQLVIDASGSESLWNVTIDAETAGLLDSDDWTSKDNLTDLRARLTRPTATSAKSLFGPMVVSPNPVADGSSYRVLEIPKESPNDGARTVVTNPADATASPFGWHDTNGAAGGEFQTTQGNNAHAYLDQDSNNAADFGGSPSGGPTLAFDFPADLTQHAQHYRDAVAANLFYMNNTFHDVLYGYGFTEAAGNFQANNYGRGGTGGDYVRAEAADGAGVNNANFSTPVETPASAGTPRMQMFLWPGDQFGFQNQVVVNGVGTFNSSWSRFGGTPTVAGTSGQFVNAGNGCVAADYAGAAGRIAVVTGGNTGCQNVDKARQAGANGAIAVVMAAGTTPAVLTGSQTTAVPNIPVASITAADGTTIRNAISAGTTTGTVRKHPNHPGIRDGDFENGIIIHEYGHGVSNRLTGGPAVNCLTGDEQGGEGWSDWYALTLTLNPAVDNPEGPRGMGPYALHQNTRGDAGIRPRPYSRNWAIQPFSYDSIRTGGWLNGTSLAVPHGVGHGWAAMLWDALWELVDKHGFNANVYGAWNSGGNNRALQYVTDGLKMQGCSPGFVAARNGIIAATQALGGQDTCTVWAAFARRGLGYSAAQGTTGRDDNTEAYDTHPDCKRGFQNIAPGPTLNVKKAGTTLPMKFSTGGNQGLDILAANNPYSRLVECNTLRTVDPTSPNITPRPAPIPAQTNRNVKLSYDASEDLYHFNWRTPEEWGGSCREFVLTRKDGVQHRAFFRFDASPSFPVSGEVRDASGALVAGATVRLDGGALPFVITTDSNGAYAFEAVTSGTYTATASAGGCNDPHTQQIEVKNPTRLDFALPERTDAFGYKCRLLSEPFAEGDTVVPITGDDTAGNVAIPFPFTLYGQTSTQARICTNGWVEIGQTSGGCSFSNAAIPSTARPNGAVYALWDDLFVDALASIRTGLTGTAPNRQFVIEWRNVHFFGDISKRVDVNVVLRENGEILTQYRNIADDARERGDSATIGIENAGGTTALQFSLNQAVLGVQPAVTTIRYRPPATFPVSGQVRAADGTPAANATVTLERPQLAVTATTDAGGNYAFSGVPEGSYSASATAGMCRGARQPVTVSGPTTLNFTLGDQTDTFGYSCSLVDLPYEEANTVVPITGDDVRGVVGTIALGFPFTFYGQTYTQAHVCTNGFLELVGPSTGTCPFGNAPIPGAERPNAAIYPFWDDLLVDASASIRTDTLGTAPNRRFVIEWRNVHFFGDTTRRVDFNVVLHENGHIVTQYRNIAADGREQGNSATIGIENAAGNVALQFSTGQAVLGPAPAVTSIDYRPPA
jgi:extracellular elastinolytic metalloproteinase